MNTDLQELKELVTALKSEQSEQQAKDKRDAWTKYVSLSMIVLAVLAAVSTQHGAGYSSATMKQLNEATFHQAEASDQWAFYQAKGIKQSLYELEIDKGANSTAPPMLAELTAKAQRYASEKQTIKTDAEAFEKKRDAARDLASAAAQSGRELGLATTLFQISIALGGVCLVVKKRGLWYISLVFGLIASVQFFKVQLIH